MGPGALNLKKLVSAFRAKKSGGSKGTKKKFEKNSSALSSVVTGGGSRESSVSWAVPRGHNTLLSFC
jgi:hypothetical protein